MVMMVVMLAVLKPRAASKEDPVLWLARGRNIM